MRLIKILAIDDGGNEVVLGFTTADFLLDAVPLGDAVSDAIGKPVSLQDVEALR